MLELLKEFGTEHIPSFNNYGTKMSFLHTLYNHVYCTHMKHQQNYRIFFNKLYQIVSKKVHLCLSITSQNPPCSHCFVDSIVYIGGVYRYFKCSVQLSNWTRRGWKWILIHRNDWQMVRCSYKNCTLLTSLCISRKT